MNLDRKLTVLARVALELADRDIAGCIYDEMLREDNHWSGTAAEMADQLGRPLTAEETTVLSLSRAFGPLPALTEAEGRTLITRLWPKGNDAGLRYPWAELSAALDLHAATV